MPEHIGPNYNYDPAVFVGLGEQMTKLAASDKGHTWSGELPVNPDPDSIRLAGSRLLDIYGYGSSKTDSDGRYWPAAFYLTDGNTQIGIRYTNPEEQAQDRSIEVVESPPQTMTWRWDNVMTLQPDNSILIGEHPLHDQHTDKVLNVFADVVAASRWGYVFETVRYSREQRKSTVRDLIEVNFGAREAEIERLQSELDADRAFVASQQEYYGASYEQEVIIRTEANVEEDGESTTSLICAADGDAVDLIVDALQKFELKPEGYLGHEVSIELLVAAGLKRELKIDPYHAHLQEFANRFHQVFNGIQQ